LPDPQRGSLTLENPTMTTNKCEKRLGRAGWKNATGAFVDEYGLPCGRKAIAFEDGKHLCARHTAAAIGANTARRHAREDAIMRLPAAVQRALKAGRAHEFAAVVVALMGGAQSGETAEAFVERLRTAAADIIEDT